MPDHAPETERHRMKTSGPIELLNTDAGLHDTTSCVTAESTGLDASNGRDWSVSMRRLRGGLSDGVDVVTINNGRLRLEILPTRGMGVWRGEVDGVPLKWNSPVERPVHPALIDPMRRGGIGWLDGFNELICRCGLAWHGAPGRDVIRDSAGNVVSDQFLTLHGRIANLAAHHVFVVIDASDGGRISVTGIVDEASMFGGRLRLISTLTSVIGSSSFQITDRVVNLAGTPAEVELLYHCNLGEPFLAEGSVFHSAVAEVAPRDPRAADGISMWNLCQGPTPDYAEQVYFTSPLADGDGFGTALLCSPDSRLAFCLRFDTSTLPWLTLWKNTQSTADGYVVGIEPASCFPNLRTREREQGRVIRLAPAEDITFRLAAEVSAAPQRTRQLIDAITARQVAASRTVHSLPKQGWSA